MIAAIVAVDNNWGIGYNGDLLEKIPEDLKYFKELITDKLLITGRKTYDSLPKKAFAKRSMIVVTNQHILNQPNTFTQYMNLENCINFIKQGLYKNDKDIFIIGGSQIYKELLSFCDRVYVTKIYKDHKNVDSYFPNLDKLNEWTATAHGQPLTYNDLSYQFWEYDRIS